MINPNVITTVRVGQLPSAPISLTDNIPHEVGSDLHRATIEELSIFIADYVGTVGGVGFRPVTVTDGQTLPNTTQKEWILVGKGTFYNVNGGATIVTTEELNAIMSDGFTWSLGVEISIAAELIGIVQTIRESFTTTAPSEDAVFKALALKANDSNVVHLAGAETITGDKTHNNITYFKSKNVQNDGGQLGTELLTTATGDASWTGSNFATGYTHVEGSVTTLTSTLAAVINNLYQITYTVTGRTAGSFTIAFGGFLSGNITSTSAIGPKATTTGTLVITPTSDFNGTIILSIKNITAGSATITILNSIGAISNEIRAIGTTNVANGRDALQSNTTGFSNTATGQSALQSNTTGFSNTANGRDALLSNTTGIANTANGQNALRSNTTGNNNTANGFNAGRYIADKTTGATILNNSVLLGYRTSPLADNQTNQVVIGYDATGLGSNTTVLGNDSTIQTWLGGRLTIGSKIDDGINRLQVTGTISSGTTTLGNTPPTANNQLTRKDYVDTGLALKANLASSTFTGAVTATSFINSTAPATNVLLAGGTTLANPISGTGTTGYLPKFTSAGVLGNSDIYDNGTNIGIGTLTPNRKLEVSDSDNQISIKGSIPNAPTYFSFFNSGNIRRGYIGYPSVGESSIYIANGELGNILLMPSNGNVLINTTTDNGVDKLQVNGSAKFSSSVTANGAISGTSATFAGAVKAAPGTLSNELVTRGQLDAAENIIGSSDRFNASPLANMINVDRFAIGLATYIRVGNMVTAQVEFTITPIASGLVAFDFKLPFARGGNAIGAMGHGTGKLLGYIIPASVSSSTTHSAKVEMFTPNIHEIKISATIQYDVTI